LYTRNSIYHSRLFRDHSALHPFFFRPIPTRTFSMNPSYPRALSKVPWKQNDRLWHWTADATALQKKISIRSLYQSKSA